MDLIRKIFKGDKVIWMIFALLCVVSIIEVFSAASTLTYKTGNHWAPIMQHSLYLLLGLFAMLIIQNVRYQWFKVIALILPPIALGLLIYVTVFGAKTNGAARWINFFGITFQPSEVAKLGLMCSTAFFLAKYQLENFADKKALKWVLIMALPIIFIIALENLSTALLLGLVTFAMLFIGRVKLLTLVKTGAIGILSIAALVGAIYIYGLISQKDNVSKYFHRATTWVNRITSHINDEENSISLKDYMQDNAQRGHANIAIATSHIVGVGPGNSVQRDFLSQAFSDFIYAIIIEELGLVGGIGVTLLYIWLLIRIGKIARKCRDPFSTFLILGIGLMLVSQAILNMMVAVGLFPITGQPLPLISKGGSSGVINCVLLGMVLSVSYYTDLQIEKEERMKEAKTRQELDEIRQEGLEQMPQSAFLQQDGVFSEESKN